MPSKRAKTLRVRSHPTRPSGSSALRPAHRLELLWDEARRQLVRQEAALDTLRTQAVAVLSVASIVAGLFGSHVPTSNLAPNRAAEVVASFAFFGVTEILAIIVLWPRTWNFAHGIAGPLGDVENGTSVNSDDVLYTWTKHFEAWRATNQRKLDCLMTCFAWACALAGLQVIAWGLAIV
jgi:hypothetical protein